MEIAKIVAENVARVRAEIAAACARAQREVTEVTLVGVTKSVDRATADALIAAGVHDIGENRVQDAMAKFGRRSTHPPLPDHVRLHMIGNLQTNKARDVVSLFASIYSLNRSALADALAYEAVKQNVQRDVLLEINIAADPQKQGAARQEVEQLMGYVENSCEGLHIRGLMTIAPNTTDDETIRAAFRGLREMRDALQIAYPGADLSVLSMGMSNDFPIAIEEGATHIRVGRALFVGLPSPREDIH